MNITEKIAETFKVEEELHLSVKEIKERVWEFDDLNGLTRTNSTSIIPSDYCYNRTNKGAHNIHLFEWKRGNTGHSVLITNITATFIINRDQVTLHTSQVNGKMVTELYFLITCQLMMESCLFVMRMRKDPLPKGEKIILYTKQENVIRNSLAEKKNNNFPSMVS